MIVLFLHLSPPLPFPHSVYLSSHPLLVGDGGSWPLDRCLPPSPQVAGIWNKAKFPFHFWVVSSWSPQHTPPFGNRFWAPVLSWHLALLGLPGACCGYDSVLACSLQLASPRYAIWRTFLATTETICFEDPPCFSLARHRLPNYTFLGGMETCVWDELMSSKTG